MTKSEFLIQASIEMLKSSYYEVESIPKQVYLMAERLVSMGVKFDSENDEKPETPEQKELSHQEKLVEGLKNIRVNDCEFGYTNIRIKNLCHDRDIKTMYDLFLYGRKRFLKIRNCGRKSDSAINEWFVKYGLNWDCYGLFKGTQS